MEQRRNFNNNDSSVVTIVQSETCFVCRRKQVGSEFEGRLQNSPVRRASSVRSRTRTWNSTEKFYIYRFGTKPIKKGGEPKFQVLQKTKKSQKKKNVAE